MIAYFHDLIFDKYTFVCAWWTSFGLYVVRKTVMLILHADKANR